MAGENDVVAVFRADVKDFQDKVSGITKTTDQLTDSVEKAGMSWTEFMKGKMGPYMAQMGSHEAAIKRLSEEYKVYKATGQAAAAQTQQFTTHTKGAADSIKTLSRGLGGVSGLLGITGKLLGVNVEQMQGLIIASHELETIARDISHSMHLQAVATGEATAATEAQTVAEKGLQVVTSLGVGLYVAIGTAIVAAGVAIWNYVKGQKEELKNLQDEIAFHDFERKHYEDLKKLLIELDQTKEINALKEKIRQKTATEADLKLLEEQHKVNNKSLEIIKQFSAEKAHLILEEQKQHESEIIKRNIGDEKQQVWIEESDLKAAERNKKRKEDLNKRLLALDTEQNQQLQALKDIQNSNAADDASENADKIAKKAAEDDKKFFKEYWQRRKEFNKRTADDAGEAYEEQLKAQKEQQDKELKLFGNQFEERQKQIGEEKKSEIRGITERQEELIRAAKKGKKDALDQLQLDAGLGTVFSHEAQKALDDIAEENRKKKIEAEKKMLDAIFKAQQEAFDKRKELEDKQIARQDKNIDIQRGLAERGLANTLAFEEKRKAELERKQQKEAQTQKRVKLLETFLNSLAEFSKTDPKTALQKALLEVALATAASAVFAEEGGIIGEIGARSGRRRHKGGGDVLLHAQTGEGILSRSEMDNLGKRNFHLLKDAARFPIRDDVFVMPKIALAGGMAVSNAEVVKEIQGLRKDFRNQKRESWEVNKFGEYIKTSIENGVTEITKGKMPKPRFRG